MEDHKKYEQAASEYLVAFINHLFNKGKSGFEIAEKLDIHEELIPKLIRDEKFIQMLIERNNAFVDNMKANYPNETEFKSELNKHRLYFDNYTKLYCDYSNRLKNIGPWQRRFNFKNGIDFYFTYKKRYSGNDIEVLTQLSTGAAVTDLTGKLPDRNLSPEHELRIINDIMDGHTLTAISEKYNCSELAVKQTADAQLIALPVTDADIRLRIVQAVKEGYNLEQLTKRFEYDEEEIKELIKIHRIEPVRNLSR